eukprot:42608-Eustigmatos_ZCMA.PRE.1
MNGIVIHEVSSYAPSFRVYKVGPAVVTHSEVLGSPKKHRHWRVREAGHHASTAAKLDKIFMDMYMCVSHLWSAPRTSRHVLLAHLVEA